MKKVLKFSGAIAFVLGVVAFILMMATHALVASGNVLGVSTSGWFSGVAVIFGNGAYSGSVGGFSGNGNFEGTLAWNALLAFIFAIVAIVIVCAGVVLPLLKIKALDKFSGILNLVAIGLFVVAGVFLFFTVPAFGGANDMDLDGWSLGAGWVISAILYLVAGGFAALPVVGSILGK